MSIKDHTKKCSQCSEILPLGYFTKRKHPRGKKKEEWLSICKMCYRIRYKKWMHANKDRYLAYLDIRKTFERKEPVCAWCHRPHNLVKDTFDNHTALYHPECISHKISATGCISKGRQSALQELSMS